MESAKTFETAAFPNRVLVVDDDELIVRSYERALGDLGYTYQNAGNGLQALERFRANSFDVILSDLDMPDMDGLTFLREVRRLDLDIPVIIVTGNPSVDSAVKAIDAGAFLYLVKPISPKQLAETLERGVNFHQMARLRRQAMALVMESGHALGDLASVEARFEAAISTCRMAFQPVVSWKQGRTLGYEALLRTQEPTLARPDHFIEAASRLGRLHTLGRVIRARIAAEAEKAAPDQLLLVNLHPSDLQDDDLIDPNAPLSRLASRTILEITERASLQGVVDLRDRLESLRRLGYRLAVDDLGAGYAGLSSVAIVQPELVKIDMSLVRGIDSNVAKQALVGSMVDMSAKLKIQIVVEGVETKAERDTLASIGCDLMQGYLFGRPAFAFETPTL